MNLVRLLSEYGRGLEGRERIELPFSEQ